MNTPDKTPDERPIPKHIQDLVTDASGGIYELPGVDDALARRKTAVATVDEFIARLNRALQDRGINSHVRVPIGGGEWTKTTSRRQARFLTWARSGDGWQLCLEHEVEGTATRTTPLVNASAAQREAAVSHADRLLAAIADELNRHAEAAERVAAELRGIVERIDPNPGK